MVADMAKSFSRERCGIGAEDDAYDSCRKTQCDSAMPDPVFEAA
jgi:hypothetical protein